MVPHPTRMEELCSRSASQSTAVISFLGPEDVELAGNTACPRVWNHIHRGERTFCIRSLRTGDVKDFRLERKHYDGREIHAYTFRSEDGIEVDIFAD